MWKTILSVFAFIGSALALFGFAKSKGKSEEKQKQLKVENENIEQNLNINKKVSGMSFDDKSDFLLSKQKARNSNSSSS